MSLWLVMWAACTPPEGDGSAGDTDPTDPVDTAPTLGTSGTTGTTGDTGPVLDYCSILPPVPAPFETMTQFTTAEDFDIDIDGYLCSINNEDLVCKNMYGDTKVLAPGAVSGESAGTRVLPTGDWVICDPGRGAVVRVDVTTGSTEAIATGLQYPNGLEVDDDNMVYVAENSGAKVRQVDAYTGEQWVVAEGLTEPNGVILSPDNQTMYVGTFGGGVIYAIDRLGPTEWDEERIFYDPVGRDGGFDGINVDVCGNVYITEFVAGRVYRITPDGSQTAIVAELPLGWIPNLRWGHGIGGWETDVLYVTAFSEIYAMSMGIDGKKHVVLP